MTNWRWLLAALRSTGALAALLASSVLLAYLILAITVFFLIAWDVGIPPAGTFAKAVNDFFEHRNVFLPALTVVVLEVIAFVRNLVSDRSAAPYWRFTALNLVVTLISIIVAAAGMLIARLIFPNHDPWEGDQSYGVALVYWGLIVVGAVIAFFARLAWIAPSGLRLKRRLPAQ